MYSNVKNIIAVHSCKGGVGKSTVASALALTLASRGIPVGICDLDICGPSLAELFALDRNSVHWRRLESNHVESGENATKPVTLEYSDHTCAPTEDEPDELMFLEPKECRGVKIMSSEFLRPKNYSGYSAYRGPIIDRLCYEMVYKTNWQGLEYLILDLPPGTSDVVISLVENVHISASILVTTPHVLSNNDLVKGIKLFRDLEIPILSIVENMAFFQCESCCKVNHLFGPSNVEKICKEHGIGHFVRIPVLSSEQNAASYNCREGEGSAELLSILSRYCDSPAVGEPLGNLVDYLHSNLKFGDQGRPKKRFVQIKRKNIFSALRGIQEDVRLSAMRFRRRESPRLVNLSN